MVVVSSGLESWYGSVSSIFCRCVDLQYSGFNACNFVAAKEAEAAGLLEGMMYWVKSLNFSKVEFELDAKEVVDEVKGDTVNVTEFGSIIVKWFLVVKETLGLFL
ncbi:hypothetical protein PTKIN_Ptkin09bG0078800 [Pterospermum kingtungense]